MTDAVNTHLHSKEIITVQLTYSLRCLDSAIDLIQPRM